MDERQAAKYRSARWQRKSKQIMDRDGWACQVCHDTDGPLQVHHLLYSTDHPADEPERNLITLCRGCHQDEENAVNRTAEAINVRVLARLLRKHRALVLVAELPPLPEPSGQVGGPRRVAVVGSSGEFEGSMPLSRAGEDPAIKDVCRLFGATIQSVRVR